MHEKETHTDMMHRVASTQHRLKLLGGGKTMLGVELPYPAQHPAAKHVRGIFPKIDVVVYTMLRSLPMPPLLVQEYTEAMNPVANYTIIPKV